MRRLAALALAALLAGCTGPPPQPPAGPSGDGGLPNEPPVQGDGFPALRLERVLQGLVQPVYATHAGDGSGRLFLVEQPGRVLAWRPGDPAALPWLDLTALVGSGGERGLLGLAFDPAFAESGRVFVHYTDRLGDTVLARYQVSRLTGAPDPTGGRTLLQVDQPYANHNGGQLAFGPDGFLYLGLGDGGSGGDPHDHGQNTDSLLGKLLRLDVRGDGAVAPRDNPFAGGGGRAEVWAYGLRNPWRFSFDRATGDLYIGDVGQNALEEVDFQPRASRGGENYGWNWFEGTRRYKTLGDAPPTVAPVAEYGHAGGHCSVTGGYVYRGEAVPALLGTYVFGDYCSGQVWGLRHGGGTWAMRAMLDTDLSISSFGEDEDGELYVVDHAGSLHRVAAAP